MTPTTITRSTTHPKHAARPTAVDAIREAQAFCSAEQGIHVPLAGARHFPEAAAQVDQAEGAWFAGRVA